MEVSANTLYKTLVSDLNEIFQLQIKQCATVKHHLLCFSTVLQSIPAVPYTMQSFGNLWKMGPATVGATQTA